MALLRNVLLVLVLAFHVLGQFLLFPSSAPDFLRFGAPTVVAYSFYVGVLRIRRPSEPEQSIASSLGIALVLVLLSDGIGMVVALNAYGS